MLSSMLRSLSPRSPSGAAASPHRTTAADSKCFIEMGAALQYQDADNLVLLDGKAVSAAGTPPRSPLSPAFWRSKQASAARTRIADRFTRALPPGASRELAAVPFSNLTDPGAVRVHQLRLLAAFVKFQQDLITGGMEARQAAGLSTLAFTPSTWNCSGTQALYNRINNCLIMSSERVVKACLAAYKRDEPPKDDVDWRNELETADGSKITQRRRSLPPPPNSPAAAPTEPSPPPRIDRKAGPTPDAEPSRIGSGDDRKAIRRLPDYERVATPEPRSAAGKPATHSSVNRSLAPEFSEASTGTAPPPPAQNHPPLLAPALATRGAHSALVSTEAHSSADHLSALAMGGPPSQAPSAGARPAHLRGSQWTEAERARLADTQGQQLGLSSPERPTQIADMRAWAKWLLAEAPYRGLADGSGRPVSAQANAQAKEQAAIRARWHRDLLPAIQGLHERVTRASGRPLSNPFRDELLRWPLSVRASLLRCSADSLQTMDPRGAGWAPRYRFHAELARALATEECYTEQERQLQARILGAVQTQAQAQKQVVPNFQNVVATVRAIFTQASQGHGPAGQGIPAFQLSIDPLTRWQASYNPFTRMVHVGPQFVHEQSPMPYVLRHVAAASMHLYNHRLIDAGSSNERRNDNPGRQIGSMLHALEQVPITAPALVNAGLAPEQAKLLILQTLPKQRELSFARAVKNAWESARRDTLARSLSQGGGRQGVGTIAQRSARVTQAGSVATESLALASAATTAVRGVPGLETEDTGEGLGSSASNLLATRVE